jgi:cytochrome c5
MILVSVMLAIYLGWPLAFGGKQRGLETPAEARTVAAAPVLTKATKLAAVSTPVSARPESCYKRYQREVKLCTAESTAAACKLGAADHWDMCEATGFWPN